MQWRIQDFREEGAPTTKAGAPTYYCGRLSPKLHENEKSGRGTPPPPTLPHGFANETENDITMEQVAPSSFSLKESQACVLW